MDRINSRIAQVYGYAVCFICVIVILISANQVMNAAFDYSNPGRATVYYGRSGTVSTFATYRMEARHGADSALSDAELRRQYDAEHADQIDSTRYRALRTLVSGIVFLLLGTTMFLLHWRWIRRNNAEAAVS